MLNYHRLLDRLQVQERKFRSSGLYLTALIAVSFLIGVLSHTVFIAEVVEPEQTSAEITSLNTELKRQSHVVSRLEMALAIEKEANANMKQMFSKQIQKQKNLEQELAFYRSLMSPEKEVDGIAIHGLELSKGLLPNRYQLRLILTQLQKRKNSVKGVADVVLVGVQDNEQIEISLNDLDIEKFNFGFRYFQMFDAEISLPQGFDLQRIKAVVQVNATRGVKGGRIEQTFEIAELLES
ncbi:MULTISPECIES: DUF6776 family protein [Shewanella]|uniref:MSHA biogenesis protein MshJ n=1 Tax=Shewanella japonica TaxID=93973 RepID=A0ABM6JJL6_9GAMM|nr:MULTISPECIES: DUF6776 family protein [Shewanella]ARD21525.1 hypothetical protein SJ2017_1198 [Shewanella japonica]KPZ71047.1 hypothetical protein AN944_01788 [Shewanella sp. P1-14-1]